MNILFTKQQNRQVYEVQYTLTLSPVKDKVTDKKQRSGYIDEAPVPDIWEVL